MRIQTYTIVAGSEVCNARCPFCVARMTPTFDVGTKLPPVNWRNFKLGCRFAKDNGVSTVLITGKGEPTLYPDQISTFLRELQPFGFPFIELQSNGIMIAKQRVTAAQLREWYDLGLSVVALSVVHWQSERNREIYQPDAAAYYDLAELIRQLHGIGFSVRLSCTMLKGYVDSPAQLQELIDFARTHKVEQLTVRSVDKPREAADPGVAEYVERHAVPVQTIQAMREWLDARGTRLMELVHGAIVYDQRGQNVCLANCLTIDPGDERIRQLIFFPDGHLRYDWQYGGAILL